ncbi:MAG TPA: YbaK/EbsC family protein [Candidatus Methylomirabilis sp.]|nr:YbaK/EbsC family protein [Candidatus Methylomirabilis sp.]
MGRGDEAHGSKGEEDLLDLAHFILEHDLQAEIVAPGAHMPTVDAAAAAMNVAPEQIFKSILFQSLAGRCVMVVACGNARVDVKRVQDLTGIFGLKLAKPDVVLAKTGYPAGGTPPVGHREKFPVIVDAAVAAQEWGYAGGGRPELLVKIRSADIIRLTGADVHNVIINDK